MIVAGAVGAGKTTAVLRLGPDLAAHGVRLGGIAAPRVWTGGVTVGYDVTDVATGVTVALARLAPPGVRVGRFHLSADGLRFAHDVIVGAAERADVVCVDEVGPAELAGTGHADALALLLASATPVVLVVRDSLVARVIGTCAPTAAVVAVKPPPG